MNTRRLIKFSISLIHSDPFTSIEFDEVRTELSFNFTLITLPPFGSYKLTRHPQLNESKWCRRRTTRRMIP